MTTRHLELMTARQEGPVLTGFPAGGTGLSDQDLMERVCQGEAAAFDTLLRRYERRIVAYLIGIVGEREEALDCAQEVFVRVYTKADRYDPRSPFKAWLYRIATNAGLDALRKRKRRRWTSLDGTLFKVTEDNPAAGSASQPSLSDEPPAPAGSAETDVLQTERAGLVRRAVSTLPEKYRTAVVLRDLQELSYEEIAGVLDCSIGTVKSRVNRARNLLREKLAAHAGPAGSASPAGGLR